MEKWLHEWEEHYSVIRQLIKEGNIAPVSELLAQLEQKSVGLLDQWAILDEKMTEIKEKLNDAGTEESVYHSLGTEYFAQHQLKRAVISLSQERAIGDKEEWRRLFLAYAFLLDGYHDETIEHFLYLIQTARQSGVRHFSYAGLACFYIIQGDIDKGTDLYERAKSLTPTSDVVYNLGVCYYLSGALELSAQHFELYASTVTNDAEALRFFGFIQIKRHKAEHARQLWEQSLQLYTTCDDVMRLALLTEWYGQHDLAVACYQRALSLGADSIQAEHGMAWNLALSGQLQMSMALFHRLLREQPDNPHIQRSLNHLAQLPMDEH